MHLQDARIPQPIPQRRLYLPRVRLNQGLVPLWRFAPRDHGYGLSLVQIRLPVGEVDYDAEIVPRQHARQARTDQPWIGRLDMLVRLLVDVEVFDLPLLVQQRCVCVLVDVREEHGERETLRED